MVIKLNRKSTDAPREGDPAPDFNLPVSEQLRITLSDLPYQNLVLYFYPKDNTPGCTMEARDFRDKMEAFRQLNTEIIGISKDSVESHHRFSLAHCLPFKLASDIEGDTCERYGVIGEKNFRGKRYIGIIRSTFLLDSNRIIRKVWRDVMLQGHAEEVLNAVKEL